MMRPKICLLFVGGTIGMVRDTKTGTLSPAENALEIISKIPEVQSRVSLDFKFINNIDSSNITTQHWTTIATTIHDLYEKYDGFVVIHGSDTMAYTASALSFALQNLSKPIILTGSLIPLVEIGSDGRSNILHACLTAALDIAEVCILFASNIFRGNRTKKHNESFVNAFHSPHYPILGEIARPTKLNEWRKKRRKRILKFAPKFEPNISLFKLYPSFDPIIISHALKSGTKGIIIEAFGPGNIPFQENSIYEQLKSVINSNIPLVIANQMESGVTNLDAYETGYMTKKIGAISSKDMTTESTVTKLMWALAHTSDVREIKKIFEQNLAGEIT